MVADYSQFMPMGPHSGSWRTTRRHPKHIADPEKSPERQLERRLGDHGADILRDRIKTRYEKQRTTWQDQIRDVVTAYSKALGWQEKILRLNDEEQNEKRRQAAEFQALIFSLITAGTMRWAGTLVQYKTYPKLFSRPTDRFIHVSDAEGYASRAVLVTESDYNKQMAAFVGGLTQDVGNNTANYVSSKFTSIKERSLSGFADSDHVTLVREMERLLLDALKAGTEVVVEQMEEAIVWMEEKPDFGEAWADKCNGNESIARKAILAHFQTVRDTWAREWPYFGQTPKPLHPALSEAFERALWAGYIDGYFGQFSKRFQFTRDDLFSKRVDARFNIPAPKPGQRIMIYSYPPVGWDTALGNAIVDRLTQLNVVIARTSQERRNQMDKAKAKQAPEAMALVKGEVDRLDEMRALWSWAGAYPHQWLALAKRKGAEGADRKLEPL
jgi:hypothetical protein